MRQEWSRLFSVPPVCSYDIAGIDLKVVCRRCEATENRFVIAPPRQDIFGYRWNFGYTRLAQEWRRQIMR